VDLDGGFSVPSESGGGGEVALQDGAGIDVVALDAAHVLHGEINVLELIPDEIMVVVVPGVSGDTIVGAGLIFGGEIIEGEGNDGPAAGKNFTGIAAAIEVSFQPGHIAGVAFLDPFEVGVGVGSAGGCSDAALIEAQLPGDEPDVGFGDVRIHSWVPK